MFLYIHIYIYYTLNLHDNFSIFNESQKDFKKSRFIFNEPQKDFQRSRFLEKFLKLFLKVHFLNNSKEK